MRQTQNHTFNQEISNSVTTGLWRGPVSLSHREGRQILRALLYIRLYFLPSPNCMSTSKADYCFVVLCLMVAYDVVVTSPDTLWEESTQKHVTGVVFSDTRTKCAPTKETKKKCSILTHYSPWIWIPLQPGLTVTFFPKALLTFFLCEWVFCVHTCMCSTCLPFAGRRQKRTLGFLQLELQVIVGKHAVLGPESEFYARAASHFSRVHCALRDTKWGQLYLPPLVQREKEDWEADLN